jgi:putative aldouronate transport system permease protein
MNSSNANVAVNRRRQRTLLRRISHDKYLILLVLPVVLLFFVFHYIPMYGIIIGFKEFSIRDGIIRSPWVGLKYFKKFIDSFYFLRTVRNTFVINLYQLVFDFPVPIIFALLLNEKRDGLFKRTVQTVSYLPHFVSVVVIVGIMYNITDPSTGIINLALKSVGIKPITFMSDPSWFRPLFVGSGIWQHFGYKAIVYLAALAAISPQLYDAATVDGANRWQRMRFVSIPGIMPTAIMLLILNIGNFMTVGFRKIILMYSPATYETADVISTYVYRRGIVLAQYSYGAAVGFMNAAVNLLLLWAANTISKKVSETSLW